MSHVEEFTAALRRELGLDDRPGLLALDRLAEWLGHRRVDLEVAPGRLGATYHHDSGAATVWAPEGDSETLLHEVGHALLTTGLARYLDVQRFPTARTQHWREEHTCDRFMRAFLLPRAAVLHYDEHELAELSGCSLETVRLRREELLR